MPRARKDKEPSAGAGNRKVNKSVMFTEGEAEEVEQFVMRLSLRQKSRITFSTWAQKLILDAVRSK